jgi:hypothetical protein
MCVCFNDWVNFSNRPAAVWLELGNSKTLSITVPFHNSLQETLLCSSRVVGIVYAHLKGHFFGVWSNSVVRGTEFLRFGLTIRHF